MKHLRYVYQDSINHTDLAINFCISIGILFLSVCKNVVINYRASDLEDNLAGGPNI